MAGNRLRPVDWWHSRYVEHNSLTSEAADEILDTPEKHLLTQNDLFWAEGGIAGEALQIGAVVGALVLLQTRSPTTIAALRAGKLSGSQWWLLGGSAFLSFKVGYWTGMRAFGDH